MFKHGTVASHAEGHRWLYPSTGRIDGAARQQAINAMSPARRGMARVEFDRAKEMVAARKPTVARTARRSSMRP